jgi:hypothetical protein
VEVNVMQMQYSSSEIKNLVITTAAALLPGRFKWMRRLRLVIIMAVWLRMWLNSPRAVVPAVPVTPVDAAQTAAATTDDSQPAAKKAEASTKSTASEATTPRVTAENAQQEQPQ